MSFAHKRKFELVQLVTIKFQAEIQRGVLGVRSHYNSQTICDTGYNINSNDCNSSQWRIFQGLCPPNPFNRVLLCTCGDNGNLSDHSP